MKIFVSIFFSINAKFIKDIRNCSVVFIIKNWYSGTTAINGAPPSVLSPTALAGFQIPQHNGQTPEIYANGIPHYPGECQVVELGKYLM